MRFWTVKRLPLFLGIATVFLAGAGLAEQLLRTGTAALNSADSEQLAAFLGNRQNTMAPISMLGFVVLGLGLAGRSLWTPGRGLLRAAVLLAVFITALACLLVLAFLSTGFLKTFRGMAPATPTLFLLTCGSFVLGWQEPGGRWRRNLASFCSALVLFVGFLRLVATWYGVTLPYSGPYSPPASTTVLGLLTLNTGLFLLLAPESRWFGFLFRQTLFSRLVRRLFPAVVFVILLGGWFDVLGVFPDRNHALSLSFRSLGLAIGVGLLVLFQSRRISREFSRTTAKLQESENRFRILVGQIGDGFELLDRRGRFLDANAAICRMLGYEKEELLNMSIPQLDPQTSEQSYLEIFQSLIGKKPMTFETKQTRKDGTVLTVEVTASVITVEGGDQLIAMVRDTTARKQAEARLRESEYFLKESQRVANIGSYKLDLVKGTWESSETLDHIFGIDTDYPRTIEGWMGLLHPEERGRMMDSAHEESLSQHHPPTKDYRIIRVSDGETRWVRSAGESTVDSQGRVVSRIGTIQDITEKRRSEEGIQRTQRLDSLGVLAGGIAHDFNNLLAGIFGYIDLAQQRSRQEDVTGYLTKAHGTLDRARGLTRQLLTFSKGGTPVMEDCQLFPLVRETVQFALSGSSVAGRFIVPETPWPCRLDTNQIGQVIDNLVINALQAMPTGGVIVVSLQNLILGTGEQGVPAAGRYVKLSIADEGIGIPPDIQSRIFDPFFTTKTRGHGLGLATCYSIVKRHGGSIDVESESGHGSTFHVFLPAVDQVTIAKNLVDEATHSGKGLFILMDDEPVVLEILGAMLKACGYTVACQHNGQDVLKDLASAEGLAGIVLDLTVPGGMGGRETVTEIRKTHPSLPVFVASGYAEDPVMADPVHYGFTASLSKPFSRIELAKLLNRHMPKR